MGEQHAVHVEKLRGNADYLAVFCVGASRGGTHNSVVPCAEDKSVISLGYFLTQSISRVKILFINGIT
jgi:hypothetical protein